MLGKCEFYIKKILGIAYCMNYLFGAVSTVVWTCSFSLHMGKLTISLCLVPLEELLRHKQPLVSPPSEAIMFSIINCLLMLH